MSDVTPATARNFLDHLELPAIARGGFEGFEATPKVDFDALKNQAIVVGADVVSFVKGVMVGTAYAASRCDVDPFKEFV